MNEENEPESKEIRLTVKERRFADAYIGTANGNGAEAARRAGYKDGPGIYVTASDLLRKPHIRAYMDERLMAESASAAMVLRELTSVAMSEWRDFVTVKTNRDGDVVDVRMDLRSKVESLNILAKAHGLLTEKVEHSGALSVVRELPEGL